MFASMVDGEGEDRPAQLTIFGSQGTFTMDYIFATSCLYASMVTRA